MGALRTLIVDDENCGRENIKSLAEKYCPEIRIIGSANSGSKAIQLVKSLNPDLVFLDINMPKISGFDFLGNFTERKFMVIFVTASAEFGIQAVKAGAVDYILKPVDIEELQNSVRKAFSIHFKRDQNDSSKEKKPDRIIISKQNGFSFCDVDDIIRLEGFNNYTTIIRKDKKPEIISRTLKHFEELLSYDFFIRVHKTHIINLKYLTEFRNHNGNFAVMSDNSEIIVSRRKIPDLYLKAKKYSIR